MKTYTLTLAKMKFFGRHGVFAAETESGQPFEVTASLVLPLPPTDRRDDLAATIDYCQVQAAIRAILEGEPRKLIETVADDTANSLFALFPQIESLVIEVFKPEPPVAFIFGGVSARIQRTRAEWTAK